MRTEEPIGQSFVFAQESQQQVLGFDIGRPELAGFVACEKDDAPGFLRIAFKHNALSLDLPGRERRVPPSPLKPNLALTTPHIMQPKGQDNQALKHRLTLRSRYRRNPLAPPRALLLILLQFAIPTVLFYSLYLSYQCLKPEAIPAKFPRPDLAATAKRGDNGGQMTNCALR